MKIRPEEAELFRADGEADRYDEVKNCFLQFSKRV
jgi:hypothetical protein